MEVPYIHPSTRIRAELEPDYNVVRAVNRFLETPVPINSMRMYTSVQRFVDRRAFHTSQYDATIRDIEKEFAKRSLAQRAFTLAPPLKLEEAPGGRGRLFFSVKQKDDLEFVGHQLGRIETLEKLGDEEETEDLLCVEFARGALAADMLKRRRQVIDARDKLVSEFHHPAARHRMVAKGLRVVTHDVMLRLPGPPELAALPLEE